MMSEKTMFAKCELERVNRNRFSVVTQVDTQILKVKNVASVSYIDDNGDPTADPIVVTMEDGSVYELWVDEKLSAAEAEYQNMARSSFLQFVRS